MAYTFNVGGSLIFASTTAGSEAMFRLKTFLVGAGWTVTSSGDGLATFSSSGDILTGSGAGAGGLGNDLAWFAIQSPDTNGRAFVFQRGNFGGALTGAAWRMAYSGGPATGFSAGAASATVSATATDEAVIVGGGTAASPTFETIFPRTDSTGFYVNMLAGGASENYVWWFATNRPGTTALSWVIYLDVMQAGTYPAQDVDPAVVYRGFIDDGQNFQNYVLEHGGVGPRGWIKKNLTGATFTRISGIALATDFSQAWAFPGGGGQNPYTGKDDLFPVMYARTTNQTAPSGWKGVSTFLLMSSFTRASGDTYNLVSSKDRMVFSGGNGAWLTVPWNGTDMVF